MDKMEELIAELERAEGGSRELDAAVAVTLGLYVTDPHGRPGMYRKRDSTRWSFAVPAYTTDLNAALALVEEMLPSCGINMQTSFGPVRIYRVVIQAEARGRVFGISENAATLPLALLSALLNSIKEGSNNG